VNENYESLQGSRDKVVDLTVAVDSAQTASDLAERAYQLGSDSNLDRLTQQDNLLTAQLNLVSEQYNGKTSYLGLLRAEGALWTLLPGQQR
jgi:outer membrane protein TolC